MLKGYKYALFSGCDSTEVVQFELEGIAYYLEDSTIKSYRWFFEKVVEL